MEFNATNFNGMTAMDILIERRRDVRDLEMEETLKRAGAIGGKKNITTSLFHQNKGNPNLHCSCKNIHQNVSTKKIKNQDDWLDKKRSALMVVASLIATMAFQAGVNPPENIWAHIQTTNSTQTSNNTNDPNNTMYYVRKASNYLKKGEWFYIINTVSFIASLSIILLLMSGLPLKSKFFVWILLLITWIAISDIALSYTVAVILLTPPAKENLINAMVGITVFAWICLMTLLLLGHTIRLFVMAIKMVLKMVKLLMKALVVRRRSSGSAMHGNNFRV